MIPFMVGSLLCKIDFFSSYLLYLLGYPFFLSVIFWNGLFMFFFSFFWVVWCILGFLWIMLILLIHLCLLAAGNMRHLIVESCIARNLLDTSAYFWPSYVNGRISQLPHIAPGQVLGWSSLMKGAPLTPAMVNVLVSVPASRCAPNIHLLLSN